MITQCLQDSVGYHDIALRALRLGRARSHHVLDWVDALADMQDLVVPVNVSPAESEQLATTQARYDGHVPDWAIRALLAGYFQEGPSLLRGPGGALGFLFLLGRLDLLATLRATRPRVTAWSRTCWSRW